MATYLQLVNSVLARLRESSVASVSTSPYSQLIGKFVNDAKRQVEDSWKWDAFSTTLPLSTVGGTSTYTVTGSGLRHREVTINDSTNRVPLANVPIQWIIDQQQLSTVQQGISCYYAWNGNDGTDSKIELYPTPGDVYRLKLNLYVPQADLSADTDVILVPAYAVEIGAYARALVERGEDGGLNSSEAYGLFKGILSDYIAIEASRFIENEVFVAT